MFDELLDTSPPRITPVEVAAVERRAAAIERRRRAFVRGGVGVVTVVAVFAVAGSLLGGTHSSDDDGSCSSGVEWDGRFYSDDAAINSGVLDPADLGDVLGTVRRTGVCATRDLDASSLPVGTEIRVVNGVDPKIGIGALVDGSVEFFRTSDGLFDFTAAQALLLDDIVEIGINSNYDGSTRWNSINDDADVNVVIDGVREAHRVPALPFYDAGFHRIFLEFVRSDGLRIRAAYAFEDGALLFRDDSRQIAEGARDLIDLALAEAPAAPVVDELSITDGARSGAVHPMGYCRSDRPDLIAVKGSVLSVDGGKRGSVIAFFVSGEGIDSYGVDDGSRQVRMPEVAATVTVEISTSVEQYCTSVRVSD